MLDSSRPFWTTAALVSSQDDSMARTILEGNHSVHPRGEGIPDHGAAGAAGLEFGEVASALGDLAPGRLAKSRTPLSKSMARSS